MKGVDLKADAQKFFSSKAGKIVIWGGIAVATLIVIRLGVAAYLKLKNPTNVAESNENEKELEQEKTEDSVLDLGGKAATIYNAFYRCGMFSLGMCEDEDTAIAALKTVPDKYIDKLAKVYLQAYSKILKEDFMRFLEPDDWARVEGKFS